MSGRAHPLGHCTCRSHSDRPWDRPEHWTAREVAYLEGAYGRLPDASIARRLGRTVEGVRLKAKRLGLRKRDHGYTAREVAAILGVDETHVSRKLVRYGLLRSVRGYRQGPHAVHVVSEEELGRFIREHGEWVDPDRMPDSGWRDMALEGGRWLSLAEVQRLTGRHPNALAAECADGRWPARRRGPHWRVHESQLDAIRATAGYHGTASSVERRERTLEHRRNRRKGLEPPRPHTRTGRPRPPRALWRVRPCEPCGGAGRVGASPALGPRDLQAALRDGSAPCRACGGKGLVLRHRDEARPLPEGWAA